MIYALMIGFLVSHCGKNVLKEYEEPDLETRAVRLLEKQKAEEAIELLEPAVEADPENWRLVSLLSAAYAEKAKVSFIDIALNASSSGGEESSSPIAKIWSFLPPPTEEAITYTLLAISTLDTIPSLSRTKADHFKMSLLSLAELGLRLKALDVNGDGVLSAEELLEADSTLAEAVLSALLRAATGAGSVGDDFGDNAKKVTQSISTLQEQIDGSQGASDDEKLRNYLGSTLGDGA